MIKKKKQFLKKIVVKKGLSFFISCVFFLTTLIWPSSSVLSQSISQAPLSLPVSGSLLLTSTPFVPPLIKGLTIHPENALEFDFIVYHGDNHLQKPALQQEALKLIKYFMASLTTPEEEMWVNLSPYEKDRIIPEAFGQTEMGRDLLAQDYLLKQLTASLMYPENRLGEKFWENIYQKAYEQFGTTEIPVNTFHKVWIVPDKATVYEHKGTVFIVDRHLKVMLEEDYLAMQHNADRLSAFPPYNNNNHFETQIIREILLPEIEKEINQGKNFANLRQIYNSMILAAWYKQNLKESLLGKIYVDQNKIAGVRIQPDTRRFSSIEDIYDQYLEAFKKGVYNYIKEDIEPHTQKVIPRKYFSGGVRGMGAGQIGKKLRIIRQEDMRLKPSLHEKILRASSAITDQEHSRIKVRANELSSPETETAQQHKNNLESRLEKIIFFYQKVSPKSRVEEIHSFAQMQLEAFNRLRLHWFEALGVASFEKTVSVLLNSKRYRQKTIQALKDLLQKHFVPIDGRSFQEQLTPHKGIQPKYLNQFQLFDQQTLERADRLLINLYYQQLQKIGGIFYHELKELNSYMYEGKIDYKIISARLKIKPDSLWDSFSYIPEDLVYPYQFSWRRITPFEMLLVNKEEEKAASFLWTHASHIQSALETHKYITIKQGGDQGWQKTIESWFFGDGFINWLYDHTEMADVHHLPIQVWRNVIHKIWIHDWIKRQEIKNFRHPNDRQWFLKFMRNGLEGLGVSIDPSEKASISSSVTSTQTPGGIDFDTNLLDLQIKRDKNGIPLPVSQQPWDHMRIEGFAPVIIHISPIGNILMLLGLSDDFHQGQESALPSTAADFIHRWEDEVLL